MSYIILFSSNFKRAGQYMIRCVVCRCSRLDSEGYKCALCGGAPGLRTEPCHVTVHRPQRPQEADKDLLTTQQWKVRLPGNIIRAVAQNLDDNVRTTKDRTAIGKDLGALFDIESIRIARLRPCPGLDQHFKSRLDEIRDHHGNERNASLARITLLRHSNDHRVILLLGSVKSYKDPPWVMSSCLCKYGEGAGFPFQIESVEDGIEDAVDTFYVHKTNHGPGSPPHFHEAALDDVSGTQFLAQVCGEGKHREQLRQIAFQLANHRAISFAPPRAEGAKRRFGLNTVFGQVNGLGIPFH